MRNMLLSYLDGKDHESMIRPVSERQKFCYQRMFLPSTGIPFELCSFWKNFKVIDEDEQAAVKEEGDKDLGF